MLKVRQNLNGPAHVIAVRLGTNRPGRIHAARGQDVVSHLVVVNRQPDLAQVVLALRPPSRLARLLHGRQQQCDQDCDDRDHDQ